MRTMLVLSALTVVAIASGCNCCRNMCGGGLGGGLFGPKQQQCCPQQQPQYQLGFQQMNECDPCAQNVGMMPQMVAAPMQTPCCNP